MESRPKIAWVLGDPAGIGPEVVAKSLVAPEMGQVCRPVVVGPAWLLDRGMQIAKVQANATRCEPSQVNSLPLETIPLVDEGWPPEDIPLGKPSAAAGRLSLHMLRAAVSLAQAGVVNAVVHAPLNKEALRLGGNTHGDELQLFASWLGDTDCREVNVAGGLFTTRVTSHVPLKDVASLLTPDGILKAVRILHQILIRSGIIEPAIGVAALNPHGGEGGLFGTEEMEVIAPAVRLAQEAGIPAKGPFPADTVFVRAKRGEFQGVVTMYHDQGQIATKLLGFDHGVTISGGLSILITTPAHGTAFDIVGQGIANPGAFQAAVRLAARMVGG
jgi:4-hydroxythreonine-4-phosphate dehydrogenase